MNDRLFPVRLVAVAVALGGGDLHVQGPGRGPLFPDPLGLVHEGATLGSDLPGTCRHRRGGRVSIDRGRDLHGREAGVAASAKRSARGGLARVTVGAGRGGRASVDGGGEAGAGVVMVVGSGGVGSGEGAAATEGASVISNGAETRPPTTTRTTAWVGPAPPPVGGGSS